MSSLTKDKISGFTLLELVIVLVIIAIIGVTVLTRWPSPAVNLSSVSYQVTNSIRHAQAIAMSLNEHYRIILNTNSYYIANGNGVAITNPVTNTTSVNYGGSVVCSTPTCVAFNERGTPLNCSTSNPLTADTVITLQLGTTTSYITIKQPTGFVSTSIP